MVERIVLKGKAEMLKPIITQILALHQLIENRDIGEFTGYPIDEFVRHKTQKFKIKILFYSVPNPPWRGKEGKFVRETYDIPDISRANIDWGKIKLACGGKNGYMWGRFRCTINLDNGSQIVVHGGSKPEAEERARAFLALSEGKLATMTHAEEEKEGVRATDKLLYKETTALLKK